MTPLETGPYKPDATSDEAFHLVDEFDMSISAAGNKPGDSIGGGFNMFFCYDDTRFVFSCEKMWYFDSEGDYIGQRHPTLDPEESPMSRDHYTTTLLTLKLHHIRTGSTASMAKIKEITDNTGFIISSMARRTFPLKLWSKAIQGSKWHEFWYYILEVITVGAFYVPVHKLLGLIANFDEEVDQEDWIPYPDGERLQDLPKYKQVIDDIMYPSYSMILAGWQLYMLDGFPQLRKFLKMLYRPMIGKTNYVHMMLFGKKNVPRDKVESFKPMRGGRWSGWLCNRNDRGMKLLDPEPSYNNVDVDIARKLYNETQL